MSAIASNGLSDPARLKRLLLHPDRPVQLVIAGKAVPLAALRIDRTDAPNVARIGARQLCERAQLLLPLEPAAPPKKGGKRRGKKG